MLWEVFNIKFIKQGLVHEKVTIRIFTTAALYLMIFFGTSIVSYYLLPDGFLKSKNFLQSWETSKSFIVSTIQIFLYKWIVLLGLFFVLIGAFIESYAIIQNL